MTWDHRIVKHKNNDMEIVEMYYDDDNKPSGWCDATIFADGDEGLESIRTQVEWFSAALDKEVLPAAGCKKTCCQ